MASITPAEAQAYFKRWELVKEEEVAALRRTSMDRRWVTGKAWLARELTREV
jgi:hypothetical protein